ncbi:MAG: hypothetical protein UV60_C0002G0060 [Parcubacteria group bacterium GW2011_GWA2_43_11]|nr:MAG: hypothetical protein UU89_C0003G0014 [Parcubacteria group bacterium GW2011_GWC2_42_11]KKS86255.1 MAG: hypothetical protein UV60_C0002G0060 [Parcubacteria group bacterium GW2011_GWA2_43_11]
MTKRKKISLILILKGEFTDKFENIEGFAKDLYDSLLLTLQPEEKEAVENLTDFTTRYISAAKKYVAEEYTLRLKNFTHKELDAQIAYYASGADKKEHLIAEQLLRINEGFRFEIYSPFFDTSAFARSCGGSCQGDAGGCKCSEHKNE